MSLQRHHAASAVNPVTGQAADAVREIGIQHNRGETIPEATGSQGPTQQYGLAALQETAGS
eukprot:10250550-Prorocentrum_lima.AAC.1